MRCWLSYTIWLFIFLYKGIPSRAQLTKAIPCPVAYTTRNIDNSNGLSCNAVFSIKQDRKGYIWIGTEKGLQRYDGLRFMSCFGAVEKPRSLYVSSLFPDDGQGRMLYLEFDYRVMQWNYLHHTSSPVLHQDTGGRVALRQEGLGEDREYSNDQGQRWHLRVIWSDSSKKRRQGLAMITTPGGNLEPTCTFLSDEEDHKTWLVNPGKGLLLLDDREKKVLPSPFGIDSSIVHGVIADGHDNIWIYTWAHQFYRYHRPTRKLYSYSLADILKQEGSESTLPVWISSMLEDDHGVLWIGTGQAGLLRYSFDRDEFEYILHQPGNNLGLQYAGQINSLFQDKEENIWLGTDMGISIINPYRQYFSALSNRDEIQPSKVTSEIAPVAMVNHDLWMGTWGSGIKIYDANRHLKKKLFFPGKYEQNMVWSILPLEDGTVWAGCQKGYMLVFDTTGRLVRDMVPPETGGRTIRSMVLDKNGNILLGLHSGKIIQYDRVQNRFLSYASEAQPAGISLSPIENLYVDSSDICWAATGQGLGEYDIRKRCFTHFYRPNPNAPVRCYGISAYGDSLLIVGTENDGLYFFDRIQHQFTRIPVNEEQPHWSAHAVKTDSLGKIWFTTDYAICNYDPTTGQSFVSQPEKGMVNSSFVSPEFLSSPDGKWLTWTSTEVISFHPGLLRTVETATTKMTITGFSVFSNPLYIDSLLQQQSPVRLSYRQNFISIDFSSLQFLGVEQTKYFYRLDGVDAGWVYGGTRGYASYTNLPPGQYTFSVKTENSLDEKGTAVLRLYIAPPFWGTWWFRALAAAIVVLTIYWLFRWHDRGVRQEASMKQQITRTEIMALRAQMNPHFIFNCINSIDSLIQSNDKYQATVYLNKFARLIRNILDSSKHETITLARDLETLQLYIDLERFRNEDRFEAGIHVDERLLEEDYHVPPLIVQPYVENAIVHGLRNRPGNEGKLTIGISREEDYLVYRIEDNGVGRAAAASRSPHHSYGMEMSRDRVNLFNRENREGNIPVIITDLVKDGKPAGTRVQVSLKIS